MYKSHIVRPWDGPKKPEAVAPPAPRAADATYPTKAIGHACRMAFGGTSIGTVDPIESSSDQSEMVLRAMIFRSSLWRRRAVGQKIVDNARPARRDLTALVATIPARTKNWNAAELKRCRWVPSPAGRCWPRGRYEVIRAGLHATKIRRLGV